MMHNVNSMHQEETQSIAMETDYQAAHPSQVAVPDYFSSASSEEIIGKSEALMSRDHWQTWLDLPEDWLMA